MDWASMSTEAEHIALANRNQVVLDLLLQDPTTCAEWVAVVAFYKSLHVVEAIFARDPAIGHTHSHHVRLDTLRRNPRYRPLFPSYRVLWAAGIVERYLEDRSHTTPAGGGHLDSRFEDYLPTADLRPMLLDRFLAHFERIASGLLPPGGGGLACYTPLPPPPPVPVIGVPQTPIP